MQIAVMSVLLAFAAVASAGAVEFSAMKFINVPAGEFVMGSPLGEKRHSENETPHRVRITEPFQMAATHVTVTHSSRPSSKRRAT